MHLTSLPTLRSFLVQFRSLTQSRRIQLKDGSQPGALDVHFVDSRKISLCAGA